MRERTIDMLERYITKYGLLKAASIFGHKDTNRVERWKKEGKIPESLDELVRAVLEKHLKGDQ